MKLGIAPIAAVGPLILLGINAWLLTTIIASLVSDDSAAADKVDWNIALSNSVGSVVSRKPVDAYKEILARPVFFKSREPFVPVPQPSSALLAKAPPTAIDPGFVLGGVMIKDDMRKVYVFSRASAGGAWLNEGNEFMGWQIKSVNDAGARLEQNGSSLDLPLYPQQ